MSKWDVRQRATTALIAHAFFRLESAGTIALTILLIYFVPSPFPGWEWWYWAVLGLAAEALILYTSLRDADTGAQVVADLLRQEFNPSAIKSPKYRSVVERALDYRNRIEALIRKSEPGVLQQHLSESTTGISDWLAQMFRLAQRLDEYERDDILKRDLQATPPMLRDLTLRAQNEPDPQVRAQAQQTLTSKQAQWQNLKKIDQTMEQAGLQLEGALSALGTVYSQLVLIRSKDDIQDSRAQRLREDIHDQISQLQSLEEAMDEVYAPQAHTA